MNLRMLEEAWRHGNPKSWPLISSPYNYPASPQVMFSSVGGEEWRKGQEDVQSTKGSSSLSKVA